MNDAKDRNPYDSIFRQAFEQPEDARDLAINLLPHEYEAFVSRGRITIEKRDVVDEVLRGHPTDLLIRVEPPKTGPDSPPPATGPPATRAPATTPLFIYVLVEHKSYPDRWVAFQLLRYVIAIWQREKATLPRGGTLPPVLPIVLYHGARRWSRPEFADLVAGAGAGDRHVPHFQPFFVNLADLPPEQLRGSIRAVTGLLFLKYVKQRLTVESSRRLLNALRTAGEDRASRDLAQLCYRILFLVKDRKEMEALQTLARQPEYHSVQEYVMTYAKELMQQGFEKGIEQGIDEGEVRDKRAVLVRQLERKYGLTETERGRIEACDDRNALDAALDEFVFAETKEPVLRKLQ